MRNLSFVIVNLLLLSNPIIAQEFNLDSQLLGELEIGTKREKKLPSEDIILPKRVSEDPRLKMRIVTGTLQKEYIRSVFERELPYFKFCYQKSLEENPKEGEGYVRLMFAIHPRSGTPHSLFYEGGEKLSGKLISCLLVVASHMQFTPYTDETAVEASQSFRFFKKEK